MKEHINHSILAISIMISGYLIGNILLKGKQFDKSVQVKGLSQKEVKADLAIWPTTITITGNDLSTLKKTIDFQTTAVASFFKNQGFNEQEITKGIINITDAQANLYNQNYQNNGVRYVATAEYTIRTHNISKLQKTLTSSLDLVEKGILLSSKNTWKPIEYTFTGLNKIKPQMIEEATKNARAVADKFAKDSNATVGSIKTATQGLFSIEDRDINTPEIKTIRVVTTIDYHIND